jgi:hypothetical protein
MNSLIVEVLCAHQLNLILLLGVGASPPASQRQGLHADTAQPPPYSAQW